MAPGARRCCELRLFIAVIMLCWQSASAQDASWRSRDLPLPRWHPHRQGEEENHRVSTQMPPRLGLAVTLFTPARLTTITLRREPQKASEDSSVTGVSHGFVQKSVIVSTTAKC